MAYTKTVWSDREAEHKGRYDLTNITGDTYDLTRNEGTITNVGTPVVASVMNNIENGIKTIDTNVGDTSTLTTTSKEVVGAINELDSNSVILSATEPTGDDRKKELVSKRNKFI